MITNLCRIIKYGLQGFFRNGWQSMATLSVITLTLFVFLSLILFNVVANNAITVLRDKIDVSVYFQQETPEDNITNVQKSLESLLEVKSVKYISRSEALAAFQERHKEDIIINQALQVLQENPLSASLNIRANDPKDYPIIASYLNQENIKSMIDQVTYGQNQLVINRLASIVDTAQKVGIGLTVALAIIAILVTLNTIILNIYSTRDEISIMRLVGAGNKFIRGPYIVQGMLFGIIAAVLSMALMAPLLSLISPYMKVLMPEMTLSSYFYGSIFSLLGYQIMFGIALGVVSSVIAVSRYLKL